MFCLCFMKNGMYGTGLIFIRSNRGKQSKIMHNLFQLAKNIKLFWIYKCSTVKAQSISIWALLKKIVVNHLKEKNLEQI